MSSKVKSQEFIESSDSDSETKKQKKVEKRKPEDSDSDSDKDKLVKKAKEEKPEKKEQKHSDSDSEEEVKKEKKEKKSKDDKKSANGSAEDGWELSSNRKVSIMDFKGMTLVNIREYYTDDAGDLKPGRKGIALRTEQWEKLLSVANKVNDASGGDDESKEGWMLGKNRKVSINEFRGKTLIDIREYYSDAAGDLKPGKKGISLNQDQWDKLMAAADHVNDALSK